MDRFATYDFLLTFHGTHWPILYRFRGIRRFQSKIARIFPTPFLFCVPAEGVPLGIGYRRCGSEN